MITTNHHKPFFTGEVKEVVALFLPIALMTLSSSLVLFLEKLFFAHLSTAAMEAAVNVTYASRIFQIPCMALAMMAQVFVGRQQGARDEQTIGRIIWQFIWFSFLSMLLTVPLSLVYGHFYFQGTVIEGSALPYFYSLVFMNFLFPLGASLSCFHLGRGRTRLILFATLTSHFINLLCAYLLIFGVEGWIPPLGLFGGALATLIAQGGFCLLLFTTFVSRQYAEIYATRCWYFQPKLFKECIYPGTLRAINRISVFLCWASVAHLMIDKQGDYLLIWSIGSTIALFLPFIGDAVCQALTTIISNVIGAKHLHLLEKVDISGAVVISAIAILIGIPMLVFPEATFYLLFPGITLPASSIANIFFGLWLSFTYWTFTSIPLSHVLAFKDTKFFLLTGTLSWVKSFFMMYVALNHFRLAADQCWIALSFSNLADLALYSLRAYWLKLQRNVIENIEPL